MTANMNLALLIIAVATSMLCLFWLILQSMIKTIRNKRREKVNLAFESMDSNDFDRQLKSNLAFKARTRKTIEESFDAMIGVIHHHRLTLLEKIEKGEIAETTYMPFSSDEAKGREVPLQNSPPDKEEKEPLLNPKPKKSVSEHPLKLSPPENSGEKIKLGTVHFKDQVAELLSKGCDERSIARQLNRTVAEVSLMIKLHHLSQSQSKSEKKPSFMAVG